MHIKNFCIIILLLFSLSTLHAHQKIYMQISLSGGLNNQKFMLLAACRLASLYKYILIEPYIMPFKKNDRPILFSQIFDLDYFQKTMANHCTIASYSKNLKPNRVISSNQLWAFSEQIETEKRTQHAPYPDALEINFYSGLRLHKDLLAVVEAIESVINSPYTAIHARIEPDWLEYSKKKKVPDSEKIFVSKEEILEKYMNSELKDTNTVYLSTGYQDKDLCELWQSRGYKAFTHSQTLNNLNYHILSAIDFEICVRATAFVGHSRSTFSNLVTHMREFLNTGHSYIYNTNDSMLHLRADKGLHCDPLKAMSGTITHE